MSVLTLFDYGPSANCLKVRILLRQLGLEHERVDVDIFAGESQRAEYLLLNPAGRTPALLLEDGRAIAESNAILLYLAEGSGFLPTDPSNAPTSTSGCSSSRTCWSRTPARRGSGT
jgi:glutathione S-transferase